MRKYLTGSATFNTNPAAKAGQFMHARASEKRLKQSQDYVTPLKLRKIANDGATAQVAVNSS